MTFVLCVNLYAQNQHHIKQIDWKNFDRTFCAEFCITKPFQSFYNGVFRICIVCGVALLHQNWKQKTFESLF